MRWGAWMHGSPKSGSRKRRTCRKKSEALGGRATVSDKCFGLERVAPSVARPDQPKKGAARESFFMGGASRALRGRQGGGAYNRPQVPGHLRSTLYRGLCTRTSKAHDAP